MGNVTQAAFDTVGVYDPDDEPHHNQVDQSGTYDSHTGNAGPDNVIDLATFQARIGPAFEADAGGVLNAESDSGVMDGQDLIVSFGFNGTKSLIISNTTGELHRGSGGNSGNRLPTSGNGRFAKSNNGDFVFDIGAVTGGVSGEVVTHFAATLLYRDNRDLNPQVTATFSGGGTVTAVADMLMNDPANSKDTFFGFVAPPGEGIVNVNFDIANYTNMDDMAFITSAFVLVSKKASNPTPADGSIDVPRDLVLEWEPAEIAAAHDVYFGDNFEDVDQATATNDLAGVYKGRVIPNSFSVPERLEFDQTYYWRVDEVNAAPDNTVSRGGVWSFKTELLAYEIENVIATASNSEDGREAQNTVDGSGLDPNGLLHGNTGEDTMWLSASDANQPAWIEFEFLSVQKVHEMWVWNSNEDLETDFGLGFKDVTIEYSVDGNEYNTLGTTHIFNQAPGSADYAHNTTIDFEGVAAKYVKLTANSNWGGYLEKYGLSEVRFFSVPVQAREPYPAFGATDVPLDLTLGFRAGREADRHDVYFGEDFQELADGTIPTNTVTETSYGPLELDLGGTYFWRIDEVNDLETPGIWSGDVWYFMTQKYFVLDDFESYNSAENQIWWSWKDGLGYVAHDNEPAYPGNGTGSAVGYETTDSFTEETIVRSGNQSMPLFYNNNQQGYSNYSETTLTLSSHRDWTERGVEELSLWFRGFPGLVGSFVEGPTGTYTMTARGEDIWDTRDEFHFAFKMLTGPGSITARIESLENTDGFAKAGLMVRDALSPESANAALLLTPENGVRFQYRQTLGDTTDREFESDLVAPLWLKLERDFASNFKGYYSSDGVNFQALSLWPNVPMGAAVYIGLALTSHNVDLTCEAKFSGVQITGTVTGQWQSQDIGIASNSAESMYVAVGNSSGAPGIVFYDDPAPTQIVDWTEWTIATQAFADQGVNLADVDNISIGIGDRNNPQPGGSGTMFIDDIRLYPHREPPVQIWFEAESADVIGSSWRFYDDPNASNGQHIGSDDGDGNDNNTAPGAEWLASYNFTAPAGVYKILFRGREAGSDSFWVRIPSAINLTPGEDPDQPGSGWVRFNGMDAPDGWAWDEVHSNDHDNVIANWILPAGEHTLEIGKREDGTLIDAIVITDDLDMDQTILSDAIPQP